MYKFLFLVIIILFFTSCTTIRLGVELIKRELDGEGLIKNEKHVKNELERILKTPQDYTMTAYTRQVFSPDLKRTKYRYHSFYVITNNVKNFFTLSFSGTKKRPRSIGVWAINTDSDTKSYDSYLYGNNEWSVENMNIIIDTEQTLTNIIDKIDSDINYYYYNDHKRNRDNMENCNTALQNTIVANSVLEDN